MINFIICDDEEIFRDSIKEKIDSCMMKSTAEYKTYFFSCYDEKFFNFAKNPNGFNVYFLDIQMPEIDGIDVARYVRYKLGDWSSLIIFVILTFIYIGKIIKYNKLKVKNSILYECMANIEDYQEEQDLKIHEYKNQLSKITAITSDKKVLSKIEEILDVDLTADTYLLGKIRSIPKGELKSLIYYKLLIASRENLNFFINIGSEIDNEVYNFNKNQYKILSNLIGIFFDNAIDAAKKSKEKELYFEIYDSNIGLTFLISNTYKGKIDLSKIGTKGYTTKGGSHGKGLHLAKKMLNKNNNISTRTIINGNQFVQKIIIKKE